MIFAMIFTIEEEAFIWYEIILLLQCACPYGRYPDLLLGIKILTACDLKW
jgi:hypothetical protein